MVNFTMCVVAAAATVFAQTYAAVNLTVDLGYGIYRGYHNDTTALNVWKGCGSWIDPS
jgi:hypothetical protein